MFSRNTLLFLGLVGFFFVGCALEPPPQQPNASDKTKRVTLEVSGMSCAKGCAPRVRDALASLPWVKNVQVDFNKKQATFTADMDEFDAKVISKVLEDEGFAGKLKD